MEITVEAEQEKKNTTTAPQEQGHQHLSKDNHRPRVDRTVGNTAQCETTARAIEATHLIAKERNKHNTNDTSKPGGLTKASIECENVNLTIPKSQIGHWYAETGQVIGVDAQDAT